MDVMKGSMPFQTGCTASLAKCSLFIGSILSACALSAFAQGTVNFANVGVGFNAPVYSSDGTTRLSGSGWTVEFMAGPTLDALRSAATTTMLSGGGAGYFAGGTVVISNVSPGATAWCVVRVWATQFGSFTNAYYSYLANSCGASAPFQVVLGNVGIPPTTPAPLTGLTAFDVGSLAFFEMGLPTNLRAQLSATNTLSFTWNSWQYIVQQTPSLYPAQWVTITNAPQVGGSAAMRMTLPTPGTHMYYRLVRYF